jgi:hypothetical protein
VKLDKALWLLLVVFALTLFATVSVDTARAATPITFSLDERCNTSAGVYQADGTLVRTLWSKKRFNSAGTYSAAWDGLDDNSNPAPAGIYEIKLLQHNTEYVWDGAIGNTSLAASGPTVHSAFYPMRAMAIAGTKAFYVSGYNEGKNDFCSFLTTDPQRVVAKWNPDGNPGSPANIYDPDWNFTAADGDWVYFGSFATLSPANSTLKTPGCVVAFQVTDNSPAHFASGVMISNGPNKPFPGIYAGTQAGLSGLAVQQTGNLLAVSVSPDNRVYLFDKRSGAAVTNLVVSIPGRLSFSPDGSLWVISGNSVIRYTNLSSKAAAMLTIPNLDQPLDLAVDPGNSNLILVADGGTSQQVKAFDSSGKPLWIYGLAGGYQANGVAVTTNKFWFYDGRSNGSFLCFAPDGSFWVGDGGNHRSLHFSSARNYLEQIMYQPTSYKTCVDQNNPSRVFNQFLEFKVDYTKPLAQSWTLINNWKANVSTNHFPWNEGLYEVTTFTNGRTYALLENTSFQFAPGELCELGSNQLRFTGILPLHDSTNSWISLGPDGSVRRTIIGSPLWYQASLKSFDASGNPIWSRETLIASAPSGSTDPVPRCCSFGNIRTTISANNILISFDQSLNNGWHLGGVRLGTTNWVWKASPAGNLNGLGNYEISNGVSYAGNTLQAVDRNIIYGYHGEFFRHQGQASQHMHFYDDGLFVGEFGEASPGHSCYEGALPGFAGNGHCPSLIKTSTGEYYLWVNDESAHGPQRWHLVNARNIREQIGSGPLGSTIVLTNQTHDFPTAVSGAYGNSQAFLSWNPIAGASLYNVYSSHINGGPYQTLVGSTSGTNYLATGLTNGVNYYFAVVALVDGREGTPSGQVEIRPVDTTQSVLAVGSMSEGGQATPIVDLSPLALGSGQPSLLGSQHLTGVLSPRELCGYGYGDLMNKSIGTKSYCIYGWGGAGSNLVRLTSAFSVVLGTGWADISYLNRQFSVDGVLGTNHGLMANPIGTLQIGVKDTNYHVLTVVSPAKFNDARKFTLGIVSTNGASAQYSINENPGLSHTFQFLFSGSVTLRADSTGGNMAVLQAIFLDDAPANAYLRPAPPTGLHEVGTGP